MIPNGAYYSKEKDILIKGTVIDYPCYGSYQTYHHKQMYGIENTLFLMELGQDVTATFKKVDHVTLQQGETVVVVGIGGCYIRKHDQVELKGQIVKVVFEDRARGESIYIQTNKMYNETLRFSMYY